MEPSEIETAENAADHDEIRSGDRTRWGDAIPVKRTVRAFLGIEAASFFLAAAVHAGVLVHGYEHREAMIAESVIGTVLLVGFAMTRVRSRSLFPIAASVQAFALAGTLIGIWTMIVGVGPRTLPDIVYHAIIVVVLLIGIGLAWQSRETG